jgi:hypothetical protein
MAGTIKFRRTLSDGHLAQTEIFLLHGASLSKVKQFALRIATKCTAQVAACSAIIQSDCSDSPDENDFQSLRHFARVFIRRTSDQQLFDFSFPAPDISIFEEQPDGELIIPKDPDGDLLASWYSDLAGEPYTFEEGGYVGESPLA